MFSIFPFLVCVQPFTFALVNCLVLSLHVVLHLIFSPCSSEKGQIEQLGGHLVSRQGQPTLAGDSPFSQISAAENTPKLHQIKIVHQSTFPPSPELIANVQHRWERSSSLLATLYHVNLTVTLNEEVEITLAEPTCFPELTDVH